MRVVKDQEANQPPSIWRSKNLKRLNKIGVDRYLEVIYRSPPIVPL